MCRAVFVARSISRALPRFRYHQVILLLELLQPGRGEDFLTALRIATSGRKKMGLFPNHRVG